MTEHTKLPWIASVTPLDNPSVVRLESKDAHGIDNDGWIIAEFHGPQAEANADFILWAFSSRKALRAACEDAKVAIYDAMHAGNLSRSYCGGVTDKLEAAIAGSE